MGHNWCQTWEFSFSDVFRSVSCCLFCIFIIHLSWAQLAYCILRNRSSQLPGPVFLQFIAHTCTFDTCTCDMRPSADDAKALTIGLEIAHSKIDWWHDNMGNRNHRLTYWIVYLVTFGMQPVWKTSANLYRVYYCKYNVVLTKTGQANFSFARTPGVSFLC